MKDSKEKLDNYVVFPRYVGDMLIRGEINSTELAVYSWTRIRCDGLGICRISLEDIKNDALGGKVSVNYVNKILLFLRTKKLIWYEDRQGCRGSFEIHHNDFITLNGSIKKIDKYFDEVKFRSETTNKLTSQSEVKPEVSSNVQKFLEGKNKLIAGKSFDSANQLIRSQDNDKDTDKDKINIDNKNLSFKNKPISLEGFTPNNREEDRCLEIATWLHEQDMRFILSALKRCGLSQIERAWGIVKEMPNVDNPRKYFNSLINSLSCFRCSEKNV